jgi:hypothetical protein
MSLGRPSGLCVESVVWNDSPGRCADRADRVLAACDEFMNFDNLQYESMNFDCMALIQWTF